MLNPYMQVFHMKYTIPIIVLSFVIVLFNLVENKLYIL